jgi:hypothetical protein
MQWLSGGGLVFLALSITFVGVDWFMSLNPDFYSTMFGFLFMNYLGWRGLAFTILMARICGAPRRWGRSSGRRTSPTTAS